MSLQERLTLAERFSNFEAKHKSTICYVYAFGAAISFTTVNFLVKNLPNLTSSEILFYRSIQLFGMTMFMMETQKMEYHFPDTKINRLLISRGFAGLVAMLLNFYGLKLLPLSEASVISQTSPAIVGVFATIFLKEKYELSQFLSALFCFFGVLLVAKPEFLFQLDEETRAESNLKFVGVIALLTGTIFVATTQVLVKTIGAKTNEGVVTLYFAAIASIFSPLAAMYQGFNPFNFPDLIILLLLGVFTFTGQMCRNKAYILGNPGKVAIVQYFGIIYSMLLDVFVLDSKLDIYSVLGALCIFSTLFVFLYKIIKKEREKQNK